MGISIQIADARQAALLLDVSLRPLLGLLMQAPHSVGEVATTLGLHLNRAQYLVGKLEQAGLAQVVSVQPRAGRAIRRYQLHGRRFIPFEVTGAETLEALVGAQLLPRVERFVQLGAQRLLAHQPTWGYWLERGEESSNLRMGDLAGTADALFGGDEPFLLNIGRSRLGRARAAELKRRLLTVMEEFSEEDSGEVTEYTVGLLMVRGGID